MAVGSTPGIERRGPGRTRETNDRGVDVLPRERLTALLEALEDDLDDARPVEIARREDYTNELVDIFLDDGRVLMIKRARTREAAAGFRTARRASRLIRRNSGVLAPAHLDVPPGIFERPTLVYWRIPYPIMEDIWPELSGPDRPRAMRSWGAVVARIHRIRFPGHGKLNTDGPPDLPLDDFLEEHIDRRLRPPCAAVLPYALDVVDRLRDAIPAVAPRIERDGGVLVHNDLHMGNMLCEVDDDAGARCIGVIDLEAAFAGPREADLARPQVLYGPRFGDLPPALLEAFHDGYGHHADPAGLAFYRSRHTLNLALHFAVNRWTRLARETADAAARELDRVA